MQNDPLNAVLIYDDNMGDPGYVMIAHNLNDWDAMHLAARLDKQYAMNAFVLKHVIYHGDAKDSTQCDACDRIAEDIIERAVGHAKSVKA